MPDTVLVALGGNAVIRPGQRGTLEEQAANLRASLAVVVELIERGCRVVLTHGNGPQVGHILIRARAARGRAYELPLDVCVAQSQGELGYLIQSALERLLLERGRDRPPVVALLTRTLVDAGDPAMRAPTKPVGPFYTEAEAAGLRAEGETVVEDAHRGWRRVVPSPRALRVLEAEAIGRLLDGGLVVIAAGGGGIPVRVGADTAPVGVEAVVDKDLASSVLAVELGVSRIVDLTAVDCVKLWYGMAREQDLAALTVKEARGYLGQGHFAPGSMGPKIEGAIHFLERGGREVIVTTPERALAALGGRAGTHLYPDEGPGAPLADPPRRRHVRDWCGAQL